MPGSLRQQGCNFEGATSSVAHQAAVQLFVYFLFKVYVVIDFLMSKALQL